MTSKVITNLTVAKFVFPEFFDFFIHNSNLQIYQA